ncbi:MAG: hypothetical protein U0441_04235 [Polyangiaceae bacterium]
MSLLHRFPQIALCLALGLVARGSLADGARPAPAPVPAPAQTATPAAAVNMEVIVLHATNDGTGIDPKIGKIPELSKPPFSSYNSYKLLDRPKISVTKGSQSTVKLPNGRDMAVMLKDILAPAKKGDPTRYVVSTSIQKPGGNTFLPLLEVNAKAGEWFFVAGQTYKGGVLVIGVKVLP